VKLKLNNSDVYYLNRQGAAPEDVQIDPLTRHTIELLQYSRKLREMIRDVKLRQDAALVRDTPYTFNILRLFA